MQFLCNLTTDALYTAHCLNIKFLWWELDCSITRVNTSKLNMLRDSVCYNLTILCNSIHLNLLSIFNELTYHNWMVYTDICSQLKEASKFVFI